MKRFQNALVLFFSPLILTAAASAQGSDDCSTATPISGLGTFAVNTTAATDSPQHALCATAHRDVWFAWTATQTGTATFSTCGGVTVDSVMAAWPGPGCPAPGTALSCNDDACGLQSSISFSATAGNVYMLQLGAFSAGTGYTGTFISGTQTGPGCGGGAGPDVIVGTVFDVGNTTAAGGIDAISLGTDACNIGTAGLSWQANNNLHP